MNQCTLQQNKSLSDKTKGINLEANAILENIYLFLENKGKYIAKESKKNRNSSNNESYESPVIREFAYDLKRQ